MQGVALSASRVFSIEHVCVAPEVCRLMDDAAQGMMQVPPNLYASVQAKTKARSLRKNGPELKATYYQWNCSSSVEPVSAVTDEAPP